MRRMRESLLSVVIIAGLLTFPTDSAFALDKVTLRLDWLIGAEHSPFFVAKEKGFFQEEGIDVTIFAGEGSSVVMKLVGNKSNDFGFGTADLALMARAKGLPLTVTAVVVQDTPACILFPKQRPITKLEDLYGKRLGTEPKSVVHRQWEAVARIHNIDRKRITEIPIDRAVAQAIAAEKVDAGTVFFYNDGLLLRAKGIDVGWLRFSDLGLKLYSSSIVVHEDTIKERPAVVRRFMRAFLKGLSFTKEQPDEALAIFLKGNPKANPAYEKLKLPAWLSMTESAETKRHGIGYSTKEGWEAMQGALIDMGLMEKPIDVTTAFTNEFIR